MKGSMKEAGLTLIELMVTLVLGSILLIGIMQIMIASTNLGTKSDFRFKNQNTANTILDLIGSNIRLAGYNGCADGGKMQLSVNPSATTTGLSPVYPLIPTKASGDFTGESKNNIGLVVKFGIDENLMSNGDFENSGAETSALTKLASKDCLNRTLYWREFRVYNCKTDTICLAWNNLMGATTIATTHEIKNATLNKIVFNVVTANGNYKKITIGGASSTYTPAEVDQKYANKGTVETDELDELLKTISVTLYVTVTTSDAEVKNSTGKKDFAKEYSATYLVRNLQ